MKKFRKNQTILILITLACTLSVPAFSQSCPASSQVPTLNGSSWNDSKPKNVYVDPTLDQAIQAQIRQAAADFGAQSGQGINVLPAGAADPGSSSSDAIRFINDPAGSPNSFARTQGTNLYANGSDTHKQLSSTTSMNVRSILAPASNGNSAVPAYDPGQPNAAHYLYDVTLHELGHAFGLNDIPPPTDPSTGQPNYALEDAGSSIMNGSVNTNDQGPHGATGQEVPGGVGANSVCSSDKTQISQANPKAPPPTRSGGGGNGGGNGGGGRGGSKQVCYGYSYDEWDDLTNTLTHYSGTTC